MQDSSMRYPGAVPGLTVSYSKHILINPSSPDCPVANMPPLAMAHQQTAMAFFLSASAPPEIISCIMQQCDSLEDLTAMISTCQHFYSSWKIFSLTILGAIGRTLMPGFDLALMAARARAMVREAEERASLPPAIDPNTITIVARGPSPAEFKMIRDLDHFAQCIQARYTDDREGPYHTLDAELSTESLWMLSDRKPAPSLFPPPRDGPKIRWMWSRFSRPPRRYAPDHAAERREWVASFRTSVFLSLLIGALLARPYQRPFVSSDVWNMWRLLSFRIQGIVWGGGSLKNRFDKGFRGTSSAVHFKSFAVFDFVDAERKHDAVFGNAGRWLVKYLQADVRSRCTPEELAHGLQGLQELHWPCRPFDFVQGSMGECEGVLWALMKSLHVSEFIQKCIENEPTSYNCLDTCRDRPRTGSGFIERINSMYDPPHRNNRVVLFGVFTSERIDMPRTPACDAKLLALSRVDSCSSRGGTCTFADCIDIPNNLANNYKQHDLPNHYRDDPVPPPPLQFYAYLLREHFDIQFADTVFSMRPGVEGASFDFKWNGSIFGDPIEGVVRSIGLEILQEYKESEVKARFSPLIMVPRRYERPPGSFYGYP